MPFASINNQKIYYEDSGGDGTPIIFMHAFLLDTTLFDAQVEALAPKYRCIRFDARAFGQTEWDGNAFNLYDTASDCIGLMDMLGIQQAVIAGISQGGYATLRVGVTYPERVKALVFISTANSQDTDEVKAIVRSVRDGWVRDGATNFLDTYSTLFFGQQHDAPHLWAYWRSKWQTYTGNLMFHAMNNLLDRDYIAQEKIDTLTMPALVIHGDADQVIPFSLGELLHQSLPNAKKLVGVHNATHISTSTHPQAVNEALLEFLAQYA